MLLSAYVAAHPVSIEPHQLTAPRGVHAQASEQCKVEKCTNCLEGQAASAKCFT